MHRPVTKLVTISKVQKGPLVVPLYDYFFFGLVWPRALAAALFSFFELLGSFRTLLAFDAAAGEVTLLLPVWARALPEAVFSALLLLSDLRLPEAFFATCGLVDLLPVDLLLAILVTPFG